jgi:hypothetical protein
MHKAESHFFQSFKERTGKNAAKLTLSAKRRKKTPKKQAAQSASKREKRAGIGGSTVASKLKAQQEVNAQLRGSLESLKRNYLDVREKFERESSELKRQLFEERETNKRLRKEIKSLDLRKSK